MLTFRRLTIFFFILLAALNLVGIFGPSDPVTFIYSNIFWFYLLLISAYIISSVILAFIPCSCFHHKVYCRGNTEEKMISISFDDGPDPVNTPIILDILRKYDVPATFFLIGSKLSHNETLVRRMITDGHLVGNHSWSHASWFDLFTARRMRREFQETAETIASITGLHPLFIRPPYGVVNPMVSKAVRKTSWILVCWSIRSLDTIIKRADSVERRVMRSLKPGSVILFHDTPVFSTQGLESLLQKIKQQGYTFVLLDRLLKLPAYE